MYWFLEAYSFKLNLFDKSEHKSIVAQEESHFEHFAQGHWCAKI